MASKAFEAGVRRIFAPAMADLGFTRHGVRYYRPRPPWFLQGIELEQNKYNGTGYCRFRIDLARTLVPATSPAPMIELAKARKSLFHEGNWAPLGYFTEVRQDYWYAYPPDDAAGIEAALNEAIADIERYGMHWLRWGIRRLGVRKDTARADLAQKLRDAFVPQPSAERAPSDGIEPL